MSHDLNPNADMRYESIPQCSLSIIAGGRTEERFEFQQPEITFGRIVDNDLVLYDPAISRQHLMLYFQNGQYLAKDLGSSNGSLLNGQLLVEPTALKEGDILDVGSVRFQFSCLALEQDEATDVDLANSMPVTWGNEQANANPAVGEPVVWASQGGAPPPQPSQDGNTRMLSADLRQQAQQPRPKPPPPPKVSRPRPQPPQPPARGPAPQRPQPGAPQQAGSPLVSGMGPAFAQQGQGQAQGGISPPSFPPPQRRPVGGKFSNPARQAASVRATQMIQLTPNQLRMEQAKLEAREAQQAKAKEAQKAQQANQVNRQKEQLVHQQEHRKIQFLTMWSFILLVAALLLFFFPRQNGPSGPGKAKTHEQKAIVLDAKIRTKVFGYNDQDSKHPSQVHFKFQDQNGKITLYYRVVSPDPVEIFLNKRLLKKIPPSPKNWFYNRHRIPKLLMNIQQSNDLVFKRVHPAGSTEKRVWGLTHVELKVKPFPPVDQKKAQKFFEEGQKLYKKRNDDSRNRYNALTSYQKCQDHVAQIAPPHPLYKKAGYMISEIQKELDGIFERQLKKAKQASKRSEAKKLYQEIIGYFPDKNDPRYQSLWQLIQGN